MNFSEFKQELLMSDSELKKEYDALTPTYELISQIIAARVKKGMTQKDLADKCKTRQGNISRLESGSCNPTFKFLKRVADALNRELHIELREKRTESVSVSTVPKVKVIAFTMPIIAGQDRVEIRAKANYAASL